MKSEALIPTFLKMVNHKRLRRFFAKRIDDYIYRGLVNGESEDLEAVQLRRYQYLSAMLQGIIKNMDKGYVSPEVIKKIINVFVENNLVRQDQSYSQSVESYLDRHGEWPPTFIVLSPTQRCNLQCVGCYASSASNRPSTIPYSYLDRIVRETHDIFGSRFMTISGGEPLLYKSDGKTLIDIFEKYNDMFFHMYTNGTLINEDLARRLADCANVTLAISVEGYEKQTDDRRGKGTYGKILNAFEALRKAGVPFGVSVTSTSQNVDLLLTDEFYEYYFEEQGVSYMWQFQLMPIGRGQDEIKLMVGPEKRVKLFRQWEKLLAEKKYCLADFWNSGLLSRGCIAYGRSGGYFYIDWDGKITPCAFIPYYVDTIYGLYENGKTLEDALFSDFMKNGREWQREYGLKNRKCPKNWLMPCSIRDHYEIFRNSVLTEDTKPEDKKAKEALESEEYLELLKKYDEELEHLTEKIWDSEYLKAGDAVYKSVLIEK